MVHFIAIAYNNCIHTSSEESLILLWKLPGTTYILAGAGGRMYVGIVNCYNNDKRSTL